ncbi:sigma-70 family RNA polymerase sigma factor [Gracilibacillus sp. S3-1-1]|uniref:Sigma-70 family RNA polymerase sigma factor n=1 Tax=Gracilibacillus pellucidus TaxID=3095368 RepID=A0ACC6M844_9BACI|nr:sigma-70 family RNA polymerase sigma factor [Gracilibacillus sp. S3-1-1]MDX8047134.1 sigma-70 family RNA polymerase sigma factor [Gracilibacillus sp. S3-1-1]
MEEVEEVLVTYEQMIHHLIHKYRIRDNQGEFYQEGLIAIWEAYQKHDPTKSRLSTYIYSCITRKFLNKIKKDNHDQEKLNKWLEHAERSDLLTEDEYAIDEQMLLDIKEVVTEKQWTWFVAYILQDQSVKAIAEVYGVTENAVKNWGKNARKKIQKQLREKGYR